MNNKLAKTPFASIVEDETIANTSVEAAPEAEPEQTEKQMSGFSWYVTHPLSREETIRRMEDFISRKDEFIAALRKSQGRDLPS